MKNLRVAIVHFWYMNRTGAERVLENIAAIFPQADIFIACMNPAAVHSSLKKHKITTSFLQRFPAVTRYHRKLLPFFPFAVEQFRLDDYDLVISSEAGPAKGVLTSPSTCHICYCHTPMRYVWDMYHEYVNGKDVQGLTRWLFKITAHYMRLWDLATAARVDYFIANSNYVASRIRKFYRRDSDVIYPPVDVSAGYLAGRTEDYYLVVGRIVDYKRFDLAVEACNRLSRKLRVVGSGPQYRLLTKLAGPTVEFLGELSEVDKNEQYAHCRALLFPGEEDFGIVPMEAHSFGRPVIAYGRGGALETVLGFQSKNDFHPEKSTGIFFGEQSVDSVVTAIQSFEAIETKFSPTFIRSQAQRFDVEEFTRQFAASVAQKLSHFHNGEPSPSIYPGVPESGSADNESQRLAVTA